MDEQVGRAFERIGAQQQVVGVQAQGEPGQDAGQRKADGRPLASICRETVDQFTFP